MKNEEIYNSWSFFVKEYKEHIISNQELWHSKLNEIKQYIHTNHKIPSQHDKETNLGRWICNQKKIYKKRIQIMKNEEIYNTWTQFLEEYNEYFT